jgi:hypothetical protein
MSFVFLFAHCLLVLFYLPYYVTSSCFSTKMRFAFFFMWIVKLDPWQAWRVSFMIYLAEGLCWYSWRLLVRGWRVSRLFHISLKSLLGPSLAEFSLLSFETRLERLHFVWLIFITTGYWCFSEIKLTSEGKKREKQNRSN